MKALLVVDVQNALLEKGIQEEELFLTTIQAAISKARKDKDIIVFIQHNNNFLVADTDAWRIASALGVGKTDVIMQKNHSNAFKNTGLGELLREKGIEKITVCGLVSHGCVRMTCRGGVDEGFTVSILKNGHSLWGKGAQMRIKKTEDELRALGVSVQ